MTVVENLKAAYLENVGEKTRGDRVPIGARIARQQAAYYLGIPDSVDARKFLINALDTECDPWAKRSISIALGFSGERTYLEKYVKILRDERAAAHGAKVHNALNLGFHLSFFGDQSFQPHAPDEDQGLPHCENTVKALIYQTGTETDRGCWQLNLYTLIDLAYHRPVSVDDFKRTMREQSSKARALVSELLLDSEARNWQETREFQKLVSNLCRRIR